jgi:hypothetical protein
MLRCRQNSPFVSVFFLASPLLPATCARKPYQKLDNAKAFAELARAYSSAIEDGTAVYWTPTKRTKLLRPLFVQAYNQAKATIESSSFNHKTTVGNIGARFGRSSRTVEGTLSALSSAVE